MSGPMEMDTVDHHGGGCTEGARDGKEATRGPSWMGSSPEEKKKAAIDAEMARVNKLPSNSSYAVHRMRVLNKLLHLLSIQRSVSQEEELELLFATLSL